MLLPAAQPAASAQQIDPNTFHATRRKSQRKKPARFNLPPHQLQTGGGLAGGGDTLPRGQDATHTGQQHVRMELLPLPNADRGHGDRMGGNIGPPHGPPHPEGHPRRARCWPPRRPKSTPELERKKLHRAGEGGLAQARGRSRREDGGHCPRTRRPRESRLAPSGPAWGRGGRRGAAASLLRGSSS